MNPSNGVAKDVARAEAPGATSPVERLVRAPLYPGGLPSLGNARGMGALWSDSFTIQRCLLRFRGAGTGSHG